MKLPDNDTVYPLPVGMKEFESWSKRIIKACGKLADEDSMKFALATQIMHLPPDKVLYPDSHFINALKKTAANQIAAQVFQDIKAKQKAAQEAALAKQAAEATATPVEVPSDVKQPK